MGPPFFIQLLSCSRVVRCSAAIVENDMSMDRAKKAAVVERQWPADKVERWQVARLRPYVRNAPRPKMHHASNNIITSFEDGLWHKLPLLHPQIRGPHGTVDATA